MFWVGVRAIKELGSRLYLYEASPQACLLGQVGADMNYIIGDHPK